MKATVDAVRAELVKLGNVYAQQIEPGRRAHIELDDGATMTIAAPPACARCNGSGKEPAPEIGD